MTCVDTSPLSTGDVGESGEIGSEVLKEARYDLEGVVRNSREVTEALETQKPVRCLTPWIVDC